MKTPLPSIHPQHLSASPHPSPRNSPSQHPSSIPSPPTLLPSLALPSPFWPSLTRGPCPTLSLFPLYPSSIYSFFLSCPSPLSSTTHSSGCLTYTFIMQVKYAVSSPYHYSLPPSSSFLHPLPSSTYTLSSKREEFSLLQYHLYAILKRD